MRRVLQSETLWVTAALLKDFFFFQESWTALLKQELADKACRQRPNVDVLVVRTLLESVRSDRGMRWRRCANMSI